MTEANDNPSPPPPPPDPETTAPPPPPFTPPPAGAASTPTDAPSQPSPAQTTPLGYQPLGAGGAGPAPYIGPAPTPDDRMMATLAHVLGIFTNFVGPLIIWMVKKEQSPFVDDQGREALNFQLTLLIGYVISGIATVICIGPIIAMGISVVAIIFGIMAAVAANKGEAYRYPLNIRFIK